MRDLRLRLLHTQLENTDIVAPTAAAPARDLRLRRVARSARAQTTRQDRPGLRRTIPLDHVMQATFRPAQLRQSGERGAS